MAVKFATGEMGIEGVSIALAISCYGAHMDGIGSMSLLLIVLGIVVGLSLNMVAVML